MAWNDRTINTLNVVIAALALIATVLLGLYSNSAGPNSPKELSAQFSGPTDPLSDLEDSPTDITIEMKSGGKPLDKIYLFQAKLRNSGTSPILPTDFFGNVAITTSAPWGIVAVGNSRAASPRTIQLIWSKVSEIKVSAPPTLLNPGDSIDVTVYLTAPDDAVKALKWDSPAPLKWVARVINMPEITVEMSPFQQFASLQGPITVHVWGWGLPFLIVVFCLSLWLELILILQIQSIAGRKIHMLCSTIAAAVLSLSCADALTTYVFGLYPGLNAKVDHIANAPPIVINVLVMSVLAAVVFRSDKRPRSETR